MGRDVVQSTQEETLRMRTHGNARAASSAWLLAAAALAAPGAGAQAPGKPFSPEKQALIELGKQYETAWDLYQHFKAEADGGTISSSDDVPDWGGVWSRSGNLFFWDQDQGELPTAKLTPEYERRLLDKLERIEQDIEYDSLSAGDPAGMPRWMTEPFLRDFAVTPQQTWLINEMANEVRRIYTDGRSHPPPEDAYPLWEGDSIGFWDGDRLIIHTEQMREGQYQRPQPQYSDQVQTVEIWRKTDDRTIEVDMWVYDPPALLEPWYTKHAYKKLTNEDKALRIRYWHFNENPNNDVILTEDGSSQFSDFTFTDQDDD
jgi:hypothetical protein